LNDQIPVTDTTKHPAQPSRATAKTLTIHDVAAALGIHKSTVSLALSGKGNVSVATRERIRAAAREMGYEPNPLAQRLANGVNNSLVCLCSGQLDVGLTTEKILQIQRGLSQRGLEVPIYTFAQSIERSHSQAVQVKQLCRQQPRAIILYAAQLSDEAIFQELENYQREGGIVVSYDVPVPLACDQVVFDREDNAYQAARHLIENGHRDIGISMSNVQPQDLKSTSHAQALRWRGFQRALTEAGLQVRKEWLFLNSTYEKGGLEMAHRFLDLEKRPTGLCIVNDYVALAFMVEVTRAGLRVPGDISLVGHDNQRVASLCPVPLSSITQPVEEIAQAVTQMLLERLQGEQGAPRSLTVRGTLVSRQSVATLSPRHLAM
jgi:DNA-binding LacI/PurR family transcriptional regulator